MGTLVRYCAGISLRWSLHSCSETCEQRNQSWIKTGSKGVSVYSRENRLEWFFPSPDGTIWKRSIDVPVEHLRDRKIAEVFSTIEKGKEKVDQKICREELSDVPEEAFPEEKVSKEDVREVFEEEDLSSDEESDLEDDDESLSDEEEVPTKRGRFIDDHAK